MRCEALSADVGAIVVTEFWSQSRPALLRVRMQFMGMNAQVAAAATGFLGSSVRFYLFRRRIVSLSWWHDVDSIRSLGGARAHVEAVRDVAMRGQVSAQATVFVRGAPWPLVLFGIDSPGGTNVRRGAMSARHRQSAG